jgi:hypothetical protein
MKRTFPFHSNAVWPPLLFVILFVVAYGMIEAAIWLIDLIAPGVESATTDLPELTRMRIVVLGFAAAAYALFRLWRFHPACNSAYSAWLEMSPWTANRPLPLGPIHLVWQDAVVVGVLAAVAKWRTDMNPFIPLIAFAMTYLCGLNLLLAFTRRWASCQTLGFLWPALMLPGARGWPGIAALAGIVIVLWQGTRASLRAFPHGFMQGFSRTSGSLLSSLLQAEIRIPGARSSTLATSSKEIGWPYLALSPKIDLPSVSTKTSFLLGLLFGWWTFCLSLAFEGAIPREMILVMGAVIAVIRLLIYCANVAPPFDIWGRFTSGRLILPEFDRVFLTPLGVILLAVVGAGLMRRIDSGAQAAVGACVVGVIWFALLAGGPSLRNWFLTGQHRYRAPRLVSARQPLRRL